LEKINVNALKSSFIPHARRVEVIQPPSLPNSPPPPGNARSSKRADRDSTIDSRHRHGSAHCPHLSAGKTRKIPNPNFATAVANIREIQTR
jgi:hypothetical protein